MAVTWSTVKAALKPVLPKAALPSPLYFPEKMPLAPPLIEDMRFKEPVSALWRKDPSSTSLALRWLPRPHVLASLVHG